MKKGQEAHERSVAIFKQAMKRHNLKAEYCDDIKAKFSSLDIEEDVKLGIIQEKIPFIATLGGDGHFLSTAMHIKNDQIPALGINTDPERSGGFLCEFSIPTQLHKSFDETKRNSNEELDRLMLSLKNLDKARYKYRTRMQVNVLRISEDENSDELDTVGTRLSLNEFMIEEKYGAKTCIYEFIKDHNSLGVLKSSGIIVSTGSGSTGMLLSARRPRISELCGMSDIINDYKGKCVTVKSLRNIHDELTFPSDSKKFYYFNRELVRNPHDLEIYKNETLMSLHQKEEGFINKNLQIRNLNVAGHMLVDGNGRLELEYGDIVDVSLGTPLKCLAPIIIP